MLNRTPCIVCWGDSLITGAGGEGTTYPNILQKLMDKDGYYIPVKNMGIEGENSTTIVARAGGTDIILTEEVIIPADNPLLN